MVSTQVIEHTDILGQPIIEGCFVAVARGNRLQVCRVVSLTPKMLRALPIGWDDDRTGHLVYSIQTVRLGGQDAMAYILKGSG